MAGLGSTGEWVDNIGSHLRMGTLASSASKKMDLVHSRNLPCTRWPGPGSVNEASWI